MDFRFIHFLFTFFLAFVGTLFFQYFSEDEITGDVVETRDDIPHQKASNQGNNWYEKVSPGHTIMANIGFLRKPEDY